MAAVYLVYFILFLKKGIVISPRKLDHPLAIQDPSFLIQAISSGVKIIFLKGGGGGKEKGKR